MTHSLAEHHFRHSHATLVAALCRRFGAEYLHDIEDAVQSAMMEAMRAWRKGAPDNPDAWLYRVAANRLLDYCRHARVINDAVPKLLHDEQISDERPELKLDEQRLSDDVLRLVFMVCDPALNARAQIIMALKHLSGFSVSEISRGLLMKPEAVKKQLQRSAKQLREKGFEFSLPANKDLAERLDVVHHVLYMTFNEGYSSASAEKVIREDVCAEASRLTHLLATHPLGTADTRGLLALMMLHAARLPARVDECDDTILLEHQDRSCWDQAIIEQASHWLQSAWPTADRDQPAGRYQLEAMIALLHCQASSFSETPWTDIVRCYDQLLSQFDSVVYQVNRAIALAYAHGNDFAIKTIESLEATKTPYLGLLCAKAWLFERAGLTQKALLLCEQALQHSLAPHERRILEKQRQRLQ